MLNAAALENSLYINKTGLQFPVLQGINYYSNHIQNDNNLKNALHTRFSDLHHPNGILETITDEKNNKMTLKYPWEMPPLPTKMQQSLTNMHNMNCNVGGI